MTREQSGRKVILLIDDDAVFRKATVMKLKAGGYEVMTAEDPSAALSAISKVKPDLILLDITFPPDVANGGGLAWDGFMILRWIRRTRENVDVPVIVVTAGDLELYRPHCEAAGIVDLLGKPLDQETLVSRIQAVLHDGEPAVPLPVPSPPPAPAAFAPVRRILFIDDDSGWHQTATEHLRKQGYEVVSTSTAEGALSEAARIRPDLMILDLKLEKETATTVMLLLLAAHPSVPLLVYAGLGLAPADKDKLMSLGVFQIMQKRSMEELLAGVRLASAQPRPRPEAPQAKLKSSRSAANGQFPSILVVEDDLEFSGVLRAFLESHSFYVTWVPDAVEGLRQIASTDFDLILTDMVLPKHSGQDFYTEVERTSPELCHRFIFMTGHQADPRTDHFIRRIRAPMLWKPFQLEDLLSLAKGVMRKDALARGSVRSQTVAAE